MENMTEQWAEDKDLGSLTRDRTQALGSESAES